MSCTENCGSPKLLGAEYFIKHLSIEFPPFLLFLLAFVLVFSFSLKIGSTQMDKLNFIIDLIYLGHMCPKHMQMAKSFVRYCFG